MTYIKHENGYWNVYVDGNPRFALMYEEEARAIEDLIDVLFESHRTHSEYIQMNNAIEDGDVGATEWEMDFYTHVKEKNNQIEKTLKKIGVDL